VTTAALETMPSLAAYRREFRRVARESGRGAEAEMALDCLLDRFRRMGASPATAVEQLLSAGPDAATDPDRPSEDAREAARLSGVVVEAVLAHLFRDAPLAAYEEALYAFDFAAYRLRDPAESALLRAAVRAATDAAHRAYRGEEAARG
jgi:hypothetical protein